MGSLAEGNDDSAHDRYHSSRRSVAGGNAAVVHTGSQIRDVEFHAEQTVTSSLDARTHQQTPEIVVQRQRRPLGGIQSMDESHRRLRRLGIRLDIGGRGCEKGRCAREHRGEIDGGEEGVGPSAMLWSNGIVRDRVISGTREPG